MMDSEKDDFFDIFVVLFTAVHHLNSLSVLEEFPTVYLGGGEHCLQKTKKTVTHFCFSSLLTARMRACDLSLINQVTSQLSLDEKL